MSLFSKTYSFFATVHRNLYRLGYRQEIKVRKKVISVGNLTFGGTGKTPFVLQLIYDLQQLGLRPAVISRSYKAGTRVSGLMDNIKFMHPEIWGDEACWYFKNLTVPIYAGPRKWESAKLADQNLAVDVLVIDDGFQHHKLHKDINIVLVDAVDGIEGLKRKSRESVESLKFADIVVISRSNLVSSDEITKLRNYLPRASQLFINNTILKSIRDFEGNLVKISGTKGGLLSGIASPKSFEKLFFFNFPNAVVKTLEFSDHHGYRRQDLKKIENFQRENKLEFLVTTEKDEVKLKNLIDKKSELYKKLTVLEIQSEFADHASWIHHLRGLFK